jgi:hypothetical protein
MSLPIDIPVKMDTLPEGPFSRGGSTHKMCVVEGLHVPKYVQESYKCVRSGDHVYIHCDDDRTSYHLCRKLTLSGFKVWLE